MAQVPDILVVSSVGEFDPFGRDAPLRGPMANANDYSYLGEESLWRTSTSATKSSTPSTPLFSPRYFTTPPSESSGLESERYPYDAHATSYNNSPTTPLDSLLGTPEIMPSDDRIMSTISHIRNGGISHTERPQVCVDTSLLFSSQSNYPDGNNFSPGQNLSPQLLSPYSASNETQLPIQPQLYRRHSHTRSAGDGQNFGLGTEYSASVDGRGRGLQRVKSAPTSRQHSPYQHASRFLRDPSNTRSIGPGNNEHATGSGTCSPADVAPALPSPSDFIGKDIVATERIRAASSARRQNPPICKCDVCGDSFTTNFAKDRHMNSHTGERRFACTKPGCNQRFPTDSGRKRHEKSKTLHAA